MKRCSYCGKEYPDNVERCSIDNEILAGEVPQVIEDVELPPPLPQVSVAAPPLSERKSRLVELLLVCLVAFSSYMLSSAYVLFAGPYSSEKSEHYLYGFYRWLTSGVHELTALALLWYFLIKRGKNFADLGLKWTWKNAALSIPLWIVAGFAFRIIYHFLYFTGATSVSLQTATESVGVSLFAAGVTLAGLLFQFLNPFFEELIVRAFLMTEVKALTRSMPIAIAVSVAVQISYHLYQGIPAAIADGGIFLVFAVFYARTNRIVPIILAHLYADLFGTLWYLFRH